MTVECTVLVCAECGRGFSIVIDDEDPPAAPVKLCAVCAAVLIQELHSSIRGLLGDRGEVDHETR